jgi:two-component system chemotaxis response regulator CheB
MLPKIKPDLVTMDIELPGMSGIEAVEQIMNLQPVPIMVLSSYVERNSAKATEALGAGALEAVPKHELERLIARNGDADSFRQRVRLLSTARVIKHPRARLKRRRTRPSSNLRPVSVIGVCSSTGGPQALVAALDPLPNDFPIPVVVVQHIAAGFTEGLVRWLDTTLAPPVRLAQPNRMIERGIWVAPEGAHLVVDRSGRFALDRKTVSGHHRPSADVLFKSLATGFEGGAVAVVLTGMGRDGAAGLGAIRRAGGLTIAQDEDSSAVFGMPRAAAEEGAELILSPRDIGEFLSTLSLEKVA